MNSANSERCEKIMNEYLMLDKNQRVPLFISLHLLFCKKCRTQVKMLRIAEEKLSEPIKISAPLSDSSIEKVMNQVAPEEYAQLLKRPVSFACWIFAGIFLMAVLFASVFSIHNFNNRDLSMAYAFICSASIIVYCFAFVKRNIDLFVKKISTSFSVN